MIRLLVIFSTMILLGCNCPLTVFTYTQTHLDLASSFVGTPDPRQSSNDFVGEKLIVDWYIPRKLWSAVHGWHIQGSVLLGNGEERAFTHALFSSKGRYSWNLLGDSYFDGDGITTFEVFLINEDGIYAYQKHPLYTPLIHIGDYLEQEKREDQSEK